DKNVAYARQHQCAERVIDHRFVVNREQTLADRVGNGIQPRSRTTRQYDAPVCGVRAHSGELRLHDFAREAELSTLVRLCEKRAVSSEQSGPPPIGHCAIDRPSRLSAGAIALLSIPVPWRREWDQLPTLESRPVDERPLWWGPFVPSLFR